MQNPFIDPIPTEVPLRNAPLVRVIAQVRFPTITAIESAPLMAPFQEAIRSRYPVLRQEKGQNLFIGMGTATQLVDAPTLWRFSGTTEPGKPEGWSIALTRDFLALETQAYTSRQDFMDRFAEALKALNV